MFDLDQNTSAPRRRNRSFVLRTGRLTKGQASALEQLGHRYLLPKTDHPWCWSTIFGNDHPVILEIGFGMGHSLATLAEQHPQCNYVGIEVHTPGVGSLLSMMAQANLDNIRIAQADAVECLETLIPPHSLTQVQLFFPDPWHKKRHHKRRIVNQHWLNLVSRVLKDRGTLHMATDWTDYGNWMLSELNQHAGFANLAKPGDPDYPYIPRPDSRPVSKFERRGQRLGHDIVDLLWQVKSSPSA